MKRFALLSFSLLCLALTLLVGLQFVLPSAMARDVDVPVFAGISADGHGALYAITDRGNIYIRSGKQDWTFDSNVVWEPHPQGGRRRKTNDQNAY